MSEFDDKNFGKLDEEIRIEQKESIKLIKNTKGYNYEIKLVDRENIEQQMDRLDRIHARMEKNYPDIVKIDKNGRAKEVEE
jgi:hypothetical protein